MNLLRSIAFTREDATRAESGDDLIVDMAFASEEPYERWWGVEILDCSDSAVRLDRLNNGAALLYNHNWNDLRGTHVPGSIKCVDGVLRGKVRITSATALGRDTIALVETDVLTKASVGYNVHKVIEQTTVKGEVKTRELDGSAFEQILTRAQQEYRGDVTKFRRELDRKFGAFARSPDEPPIYRVVDWEPFENSLVTIPADDTVGIGRMAEGAAASTVATPPKGTSTERSFTMAETTVEKDAPAGAAADNQAREAGFNAEQIAKMVSQRHIDFAKAAEDNQIESRYVRDWIERGLGYDQVGDEIIKILAERGKDQKHSRGWLGLSRNETEEYSVLRAMLAICEGSWKNAGLELEAHRALADKLGKSNLGERSLLVPADVLRRGIKQQQRDLTVASGSGGGFLVETANMGFVDLLRNRSVGMNMGVTRLSGMNGNVSIPRQTAAATAYWLATEATPITESQLTLGQIALTPKTVGAYTEVSRLLMLQSSPDAEGLVLSDLAQVVGLAADLALLQGSGASGQPTGLSNTSGVGSVTGTSIAYAGILEFQTDVAAGNSLFPNSGYVTTPAVAALLMQRQRFSSTDTPLWEGSVLDGRVAGFRAMSTNQAASATIYFGNWPSIVLAEWGVLELDINNAANFPAGIVGLRAMYTMDVGVRYPGAFSIATSVT